MGKTYTYDRSRDSRNFDHTSGLGTRHDVHKIDVEGKDLVEEKSKGITTNNNAFIKGSQLVVSVFNEYPYISKVLDENGIKFISQIPNDYESLVNLKGIGKKSAIKILEVIDE